MENPFSSNIGNASQTSEYDLRTVATIWDQLRRSECAATAPLDALSYFYSRVNGSIQRVSYVDRAGADAGRFDVRNGSLPEASSDRIGALTDFLRRLDRRDDGALYYTDLPSLEEQYRKQIQSQVDATLQELEEEFQTGDALRRKWYTMLESELIPKMNEQVEEFLELQEIRLDPDRSLEDEFDDPSGSFSTLLSGTLGGEDSDPLEDELLKKTEELTEVLNQAFYDVFEEALENRAEKMLRRSDETAAELRESDAYQRYQDL